MMQEPGRQTDPLLPIHRTLVGFTAKTLFGKYSYAVDLTQCAVSGRNRASIIYGRNGTGKTTLLNLLFHLLSPMRGQGHPRALSSIPFRSFSAHLDANTTITAERAEDLAGPFNLRIYQTQTLIVDAGIEITQGQGISPDESRYTEFLVRMSQLGLNVYELSDDRHLLSDAVAEPYQYSQYSYPVSGTEFVRALPPAIFSSGVTSTTFGQSHLDSLSDAIDRLSRWITSKQIEATQIGAERINRIYDEVLRAIISAESDEGVANLKPLIARIEKLDERNDAAREYGLVAPFESRTLVNLLSSCPSSRSGIASHVIQPYVEAVEAQFRAIEGVERVLDTFQSHLNDMLFDKHVIVTRQAGLEIVANPNGETLPSQYLSSGERQLILLLANVVSAREVPSLFLIDEPEISLDLTWQRSLLDVLFDCAENAHIQFIFASHSNEVMGWDPSAVFPLKQAQPTSLF